MSKPTEKNVTDAQQSRAFAAWYGLWVGVLWVASFGLTVWGLTTPVVGNFALLVGLASLPLAVWMLRGFREVVAPLPLRRAWYMAWMMFLCAALLTTAAQFVYFAYFDEGRIAVAYSGIIAQPEMHDMLQRMMPGQDVDALANEAITAFNETPPSQLAIQFLFWNVLLATIFAIPTAFLSFKKTPDAKQ